LETKHLSNGIFSWEQVEIGHCSQDSKEEGRICRVLEGDERTVGDDLDGMDEAPEELEGRPQGQVDSKVGVDYRVEGALDDRTY